MLMHGERLGEEVSEVIGSGPPLYIEVLLLNTVPDPMETHVDGLRSPCFDCVCGQADGARVVAEHDGGRLRIPESQENGSYPFANAAVGEKRCIFALGGGGHDDVSDHAEGVDASVDVGGFVEIAQIENPACDAPCIRA